jgi:hypothetical protein
MTKIPAALTALATTALLAIGAPANASPAGNDDRVIKTGNCSGSADWKLKVKTDDGRLEVEGEVDSNVSGQQWHWRILRNGNVAARGTATTTGRSGSFSVERRVTNGPGSDRIGFRARNAASGQTCSGNLTF